MALWATVALSGAFISYALWKYRSRRKRLAAALFWGGSIFLWLLAAAVLAFRFGSGLGTVSNMSDEFPWGIWIGVDVLCGVALAAGGFVIAATVHLFRIRSFEPILRPTLLTAFLGYLLVVIALLLDVGRPYRMWHPLVMWQHHSIMFEVAWCVTLYTTVLALEFAPVILEKVKLEALNKMLKSFAIPTVLAGVVLSTLHQSSLGSMFLIVPGKLHPFWYSPLLPVLFMVSAVAAGLAMVIVESTLSAWFFSRSLENDLLERMGQTVSLLLGAYFLLRILDLSFRGAWGAFSPGNGESILLLIELLLGTLLPALLLAREEFRERSGWLFGAALLAIGGVALNRLNVSLLGLLRYSNFSYVPSALEMLTTLGLITAGIALFVLASRFFPVFEEPALQGPD